MPEASILTSYADEVAWAEEWIMGCCSLPVEFSNFEPNRASLRGSQIEVAFDHMLYLL